MGTVFDILFLSAVRLGFCTLIVRYQMPGKAETVVCDDAGFRALCSLPIVQSFVGRLKRFIHSAFAWIAHDSGIVSQLQDSFAQCKYLNLDVLV